MKLDETKGTRRSQGTGVKLIPNSGRKACREETICKFMCIWKDNINMDLRGIGRESFDCFSWLRGGSSEPSSETSDCTKGWEILVRLWYHHMLKEDFAVWKLLF